MKENTVVIIEGFDSEDHAKEFIEWFSQCGEDKYLRMLEAEGKFNPVLQLRAGALTEVQTTMEELGTENESN